LPERSGVLWSRTRPAARQLQLPLMTVTGPINPAETNALKRRTTMADTIREKIENAGEAVKDTAKKAGEKVKEGADTAAEKTAEAAKSVGQAAKDAGQKLKDKSGV
jgi:gas vesicle protein